MSERIPIAGPSITQREIDYATDAAANGWYDRAGEYPRRFEEAPGVIVHHKPRGLARDPALRSVEDTYFGISFFITSSSKSPDSSKLQLQAARSRMHQNKAQQGSFCGIFKI